MQAADFVILNLPAQQVLALSKANVIQDLLL
jgi:hypothetical protein